MIGESWTGLMASHFPQQCIAMCDGGIGEESEEWKNRMRSSEMRCFQLENGKRQKNWQTCNGGIGGEELVESEKWNNQRRS